MFSTLLAAWNIVKWLRRQRKEMEVNAEAYLTEERAKEWRKGSERIFKSLAEGDGEFEKLPKPVRWFFAHTKADNRLGQFGQWYLKSGELEKALKQPLYRMH